MVSHDARRISCVAPRSMHPLSVMLLTHDDELVDLLSRRACGISLGDTVFPMAQRIC